MLARTAVAMLLGLSLTPALVAQSPVSSGPAPVKWSGYLQARETYQRHIGLTASINRARLSAAGSVGPSLAWRVQGEFRTGTVGTGRASVSLQDAYIRYTRGDWSIQAGQFKTPFTREFVTSLSEVETADRSTVVDSLAPKRDIGLMGEYAAGTLLTISVGAFNGEGQNVTGNGDSTVLGVSRVVVRPIPVIAIGVNGASYFGDSTRYGADVNYEGPRLTLRAEYVAQHRNGSGLDDDEGWFGLGAFAAVPAVQL
ncbi:MAG: porin, partial [Gemmatimonadales bacterium]